MILDDVERAIEAKRLFDEAVAKFTVAGVALKLAPVPELLAALTNAHEELLNAEHTAVSLHRQAFG